MKKTAERFGFRFARIGGRAFSTAAFLAVASCATMVSHDRAMDSLLNSANCCTSYAQFEPVPLNEGPGINFNLDATSAAYPFASGKSYFKLLQLPEKAVPYTLRIKSFALGETVDTAHVFYPRVDLLNDRRELVAQSPPGLFTIGKAGFAEAAEAGWGLTIKLEGDLPVTREDARFALVYTTTALMSGSSPFETWRVVPVIVPGLVTAIPIGKAEVMVKHSPFALLHAEIAPAAASAGAATAGCPYGSEATIEPGAAVVARFTGREMHIFIDTVEPGADLSRFDTVVVLSGPEVLGGTAAIALKDGCVAGRKFLSGLDLIHATRMVALFRDEARLRESEQLDEALLAELAVAGSAAAQFHMGLVYGLGQGPGLDRKASITWLQRAAEQDFDPAMLALGMALSGPGALRDEVEPVGRPPRSDEQTDRVQAYYWLDAAKKSADRDVQGEAAFRLRELTGVMTAEELTKARALAPRRATPR